jgi:hypothetical protein
MPLVVVANSEYLQLLGLLTGLTKCNFKLQEENRLLRGGYTFVKSCIQRIQLFETQSAKRFSFISHAVKVRNLKMTHQSQHIFSECNS